MARPVTKLTPDGAAALAAVGPARRARDDAAERFAVMIRRAVRAGVPLAAVGIQAGMSAENVRRIVAADQLTP